MANREWRIANSEKALLEDYSLFPNRYLLLPHPRGLRRDGPARHVPGDGAGKLFGAAAEGVESLRLEAAQNLVRRERVVDRTRELVDDLGRRAERGHQPEPDAGVEIRQAGLRHGRQAGRDARPLARRRGETLEGARLDMRHDRGGGPETHRRAAGGRG